MTSCKQNEMDEETLSKVYIGINPNNKFDDVMGIYKTWAQDYDTDLSAAGYVGPKMSADRLAQQNLPKDARILDVASGTGLCGQVLKNDYGYTHLEALDASQDMLVVSGEKNIYRQQHCLLVGDGHKLPFGDNTYDAVIMSGALCGGHVKCDCFEELIRIVKPDGYLVLTMREDYRREIPEFHKLDAVLQGYVDRGAWDKILEEISPHYYFDHAAITWVFRIK